MDPLSIAGSIAGLVTLADAVFRAASRYRQGVKGSHKEINELMGEVKSLSLLLHNLSLLAYDLESSAPADGYSASHFQPLYLHECQQLLRRLNKDIPDAKQPFDSSSGIEKWRAQLKWPFSSSEMKSMVESLRKHQQKINVALAAESIVHLREALSRQQEANSLMKDVKATVDKLLDVQTRIQLDTERHKVLDFFLKANPQSEFEMAKKLRHPFTGLWLVEGEDFHEWYTVPNAKVWLSGIPGSGKSVLAGAMITECLHRIEADATGDSARRNAVAYFFCTYRDVRTHEPASILSSLAVQLARQNEQAYDELQSYHEQLRESHSLPRQPSTEGLMEVLQKIFKHFGQVYLVVDGLDECGNQADASVQCLRSLMSHKNRIHPCTVNIAILSRDEINIRQHLEGEYSWVEIEAHTEDLQLYVATELEERIASRRLRIRDLTLKDHIMTQLVSGAKGMFRWVACQLDHLCELPTDKARRHALATLPPTLLETYERILMRIDGYTKEVKCSVQTSLQLIAVGDTEFSARMLCEAVSISTASPTLDDDEIIDEQDILRWCGSLVRMSNDGHRIEFAHFTVKEFLSDECSEHSQLSQYSVSKEKTDSLLALTCLRYVNLANFECLHSEAAEETLNDIRERTMTRPFYEFASIWWPQYLHWSSSETNDGIFELLRRLFDPQKGATFISWMIEMIRHCLGEDGSYGGCFKTGFEYDHSLKDTLISASAALRPDFTPLHMAAALALPNLCRHLLQNGAMINQRSKFGTPLHCAVGGLGVFSNDAGIEKSLLLESGLASDKSAAARRATVQILLDAGARTDLQFQNPFKTLSTLELSGFSLAYRDVFGITLDLLRAEMVLEAEDVDEFTRFSVDTQDLIAIAEDVESNTGTIQEILKLLEGQRRESDLVSRLFSFFLGLAAALDIKPTQEVLIDCPPNDASLDEIKEFLHSAVRFNDIWRLNAFLHSSLADAIKTIRFNHRVRGWTPLHLATWEDSLDVLNMLLDFGCDPNIAADDGQVPAHLCRYYTSTEALKSLLEHGASTMLMDDDGDTLWHVCAKHDSVEVLNVLIGSGETTEALERTSKQGETPICTALSRGSLGAVLLLLPHCNSRSAWKSRNSIFRNAAKLGSFAVLKKIIEVDLQVDGLDDHDGSPLHFLDSKADVDCINLLTPFFDLKQRPLAHNRTPFETFILQTLKQGDSVFPETWKALLPLSASSDPEEALALWSFLSSSDLSFDILNAEAAKCDWLVGVFSYVLDLGIVELIEGDVRSLAFLLICKGLLEENQRQRELDSGIEEDELFSRWSGWAVFSSVVQLVLARTMLLQQALTDPGVPALLKEAVIHDDSVLLIALLDQGIDVHARVQHLSSFEVACFAHVQISDENFGRILKHVDHGKITIGNPEFDGRGPLHLTSGRFGTAGALSRLRCLLRLGIPCDLPQTSDGTPLLCHILENSIDTAECLLSFGADPWLSRSSDGFNAALAAVGTNSLLDDIVKQTEQKGHSTDWRHTFNITVEGKGHAGANALHFAAKCGQVGSLQFLLDKHFFDNLSTEDEDGRTPIHYAAWEGHHDTVQYLLKKGADINAQTKAGLTALHLAAMCGRKDCVELLLALNAKPVPCSQGCTPLIYGYMSGNMDVVQRLETGHETLQSIKHPKILRIMAKQLHLAIERDDLVRCQRIIAAGCPIDVEVFMGNFGTPLMVAILGQASPELVTYLVEKGATVSILYQPQYRGHYFTVLDAAISRSTLNSIIGSLLERFLQEGGDLINCHYSLLGRAIRTGNIASLPIVLDVVRAWNTNKQVLMTTALHGNLSPIRLIERLLNQQDRSVYNWPTPLHAAVEVGSYEAARFLISNGSDIESFDRHGLTVLHRVACLGDDKMMQLLLKSGSCVSSKCFGHRTPLWYACENGHGAAIKVLLDHQNDMKDLTIDRTGPSVLMPLFKSRADIVGTPLLDHLFASGSDLHKPDDGGICAAHLLLTGQNNLFTWMLDRGVHLLEPLRFEWPESVLREVRALDVLARRLRFLRHFLSHGELRVVSDLHLPGKHNILCQTVRFGLLRAMQDILGVWPDVEYECNFHGTPLMAAYSANRFDVVKHLIRRGVPIALKAGYIFSDNRYAKAIRFPTILRWILVTRHTEQRNIGYMEARQCDEMVGYWSGIQSVTVKLKPEWHKSRSESMIEYASRRQDILKELKGLVVVPTET